MAERGLPANWGLHPILFRVGAIPVPAYELFLTLAIVVGAGIYIVTVQRDDEAGHRAGELLFAALLGAAIGAKAPVILAQLASGAHHPIEWLSGRTILGGLAGGTAAVLVARRIMGLAAPSGNGFALPLAAGLFLGRLGCLLRGCCYGKVTGHAWGVDLGDGLLRHPTQAYESLFGLAAVVALLATRQVESPPGHRFRLFLGAYLVFRFLVEFTRQEPLWLGPLDQAQVACLAMLALLAVRHRRSISAGRRGGQDHERTDAGQA